MLSNRRLEHAAHTHARIESHRKTRHAWSRISSLDRFVSWKRDGEQRNEDGSQRRNENSERDRENGREEEEDEEGRISARGEIKTALFCSLSCSLSFSLRSFLSILTEPRPLYVEKEDTRWSEDEIQEIYAWMIIARSRIDRHPLG